MHLSAAYNVGPMGYGEVCGMSHGSSAFVWSSSSAELPPKWTPVVVENFVHAFPSFALCPSLGLPPLRSIVLCSLPLGLATKQRHSRDLGCHRPRSRIGISAILNDVASLGGCWLQAPVPGLLRWRCRGSHTRFLHILQLGILSESGKRRTSCEMMCFRSHSLCSTQCCL